MILPFKREIERLKINDKVLRNFGILFFCIFCVISFYLYRRVSDNWTWVLIAGIPFLAFAFIRPDFLKWFYKLWMLFAFILSWIINRVILTVTFFVIITPFAIILRISGKDLLNERIDIESETYWIKHERINDKSRYKKQF